MTEAFPDVYSPERPYDRRRYMSQSRENQSRSINGEPKHIYKLMGSLYNQKQKSLEPDSPTESTDPESQYASTVLSDAEQSTKKVRSASAKAQKTKRAMTETIDGCKEICDLYQTTVKDLNRTCRVAFLECMGANNDSNFVIPPEWLADEDNQELA